MQIREFTTELVVHHSGTHTGTTVPSMDRHHRGKGWSCIGYHKILRESDPEGWHKEDGRDIRMSGAHCPLFNRTSIGVCLCGNYDEIEVSAEAFDLLAETLAELCITYSIPPHRIIFHKEAGGTNCPGKNLVKRKKELILRVSGMIAGTV